jgi:hypothetical protein
MANTARTKQVERVLNTRYEAEDKLEADCIQYEGRDENGDKQYAVQHEGVAVGTFRTHDEASIALMNHIAG